MGDTKANILKEILGLCLEIGEKTSYNADFEYMNQQERICITIRKGNSICIVHCMDVSADGKMEEMRKFLKNLLMKTVNRVK